MVEQQWWCRMPNGPKLLLIDGNNMAHRVFWANKNLSYRGRHTGVLYGFFRQLISLHKMYPNHFRVIAWDGGYHRRRDESQKAVEAGLIPLGYKQNRVIDKDDHEKLAQRESIMEQMEQLRTEALPMIRCLQVWIKGVEADDILNSYAKNNDKWDGESVIVSSDQDFYQCVSPNTVVYDAMKKENWSDERLRMEFGFGPEKWVDAGAIMGDKSDNIIGVEGWGPVTACKYVREHGGVSEIMEMLKAKQKRGKKEQTFVDSAEILKLALSLKMMDVIEGLPKPRVCHEISDEAIKAYFLEFGFASLLKDIRRLV
jgi:5'-3' exonuclease